MIQELDKVFLNLAIALAKNGMGHTRPNPPVGAVITRDDKILAKGWHKKAGEAHAEVDAINNARAAGISDLRGATLYVSLEPCSTAGRVGACTDAIREAGFSRVVYAIDDPNPKNGGRAKSVLSAAGITCESAENFREVYDAAEYLIRPFAKLQRTGLPYVIVKLAMTLDGKICDHTGASQWISSAETRAELGRYREFSDAILVGAETVRKDNPRLLSHGRENRDLIRAIVSASGNIPSDAQVLTDGQNETIIFREASEALRELGARGCQLVWCEGGLTLARHLADAGFVDEWITSLSPIVIGNKPLAQSTKFISAHNADRAGGDYVYRAYSENWLR